MKGIQHSIEKILKEYKWALSTSEIEKIIDEIKKEEVSLSTIKNTILLMKTNKLVVWKTPLKIFEDTFKISRKKGLKDNVFCFTHSDTEDKFKVRAYLEYPGYLKKIKSKEVPYFIYILMYLYKYENGTITDISKKIASLKNKDEKKEYRNVNSWLKKLKKREQVNIEKGFSTICSSSTVSLTEKEKGVLKLVFDSLEEWLNFKEKYRGEIFQWEYSKSEEKFYTDILNAFETK